MEILRRIPPGTVDAVLTDPPYGVTREALDDFDVFFRAVPLLARACRRDCWLAFYHAKKRVPDVVRRMEEIGLFDYVWLATVEHVGQSLSRSPLGSTKSGIIFLYRRGKPKIHYRIDDHLPGHDVPAYGIERDRLHKPVVAWMLLVAALSPPGGVVLDPFAGTGSLAVAAEIMGRRWVAVEIDEEKFRLMVDAVSGVARPTT